MSRDATCSTSPTTTARSCTSGAPRRGSATSSRCASGCPRRGPSGPSGCARSATRSRGWCRRGSSGSTTTRAGTSARCRCTTRWRATASCSTSPAGTAGSTVAGLHERDVPDAGDFRLTVHDPAPAWMDTSVVYQVFPDRFARSGRQTGDLSGLGAAGARGTTSRSRPVRGVAQQYFGGDLPGVEQRLDHLQRLGVDTLYLTPVFPGRSNHRYDASTFDVVDPLLGGDEALASLSRAVHARGMRIMGDLTTNHTGAGHEWFATRPGRPVQRGGVVLLLDGRRPRVRRLARARVAAQAQLQRPGAGRPDGRGSGLRDRSLAGRAVLPGRLAHRRRQHDRPVRRRRPHAPGGPHDPVDHARPQPRGGAGLGALPRRRYRPGRGRLACNP